MNLIDIIGIGQGRSDLTPTHMAVIHDCDILVGGKRQVDLFDTTGKEVILIKGPVSNLIDRLKKKSIDHKIAVLASGDPLFHGIGSTLCRYFDRDRLRIHPNVSSVCAAFAAIKEPWHDAKIVSLHGKQNIDFSFADLRYETKIAFLTDREKDAGFIAGKMRAAGLPHNRFCVLECLGDSSRQKIRWFDTPDAVRQTKFSHPNVVIAFKNRLPEKETAGTDVSRETHMGMPDDLFRHSKGLITKSEIRAVTLSKLKLTRPDHVLWDIGAGSGSVSVEAGLLIPRGRVYAIEKHPERIPDILHNMNRFGCSNVEAVNAVFPDKIEELALPDRVFIGGAGKDLERIADLAGDRLKPRGVIVINTVLVQTLEAAVRRLEARGFDPEIVQIQASRSKKMPFGHRFESLNPVWIISGSKPEK